MLNIEKTMDGSKLTMALEGRLDTTTAPQLEKELEEALDKALFYAENDEARESIAMKGREKCQSAFCYEDRIEQIISEAKKLLS